MKSSPEEYNKSNNSFQDIVMEEMGSNAKNSGDLKYDISEINPDISSEMQAGNYCENDFEKLEEKEDKLSNVLLLIKSKISSLFKKFLIPIKITIGVIFLLLYIAFFIWFLICKIRAKKLLKLEDNIRFIWLTGLILVYILYRVVKFIIKKANISCSKCCDNWPVEKIKFIIFTVICSLIGLLLVIYIIYAAVKYDPYNLVSLSGIFSLLLVSYIFSTAPNMVQWRTVALGIMLQLVLAWLIIATVPGYEVFRFLGDRIAEFLGHTNAGSDFVFGTGLNNVFAFRILPVVIFMSSVTSILYYLEIIQTLILVLGTAMQKFMGTTCGESLNAVANIFLGMTESPLLIRPLLGRMTNSELHAVMTGGFATIAGTVLAAFIDYGAPANHLISASVMSAPAALAVSKLICPETKKSKTTKDDAKNMPKCTYKNIVEATTAGASESISLVANIAANVIAFVAILAFFNATLAWLGNRACLPVVLSFELICSYVFWPLALVLGVNIRDCRKVAELIGIKTFLNEFIAFSKISVIRSNMKTYEQLSGLIGNVTDNYDNIVIFATNGTRYHLTGGMLFEERSLVIATYALCGFANFGSMGILLSSLSTMIPHRRTDLSRLIIRAMIAGNIACFLTASIAGLFFKPSSI